MPFRWTGGWMYDRQADKQTDYMDGWMDDRDGWMDGWMIYRQIVSQADR